MISSEIEDLMSELKNMATQQAEEFETIMYENVMIQNNQRDLFLASLWGKWHRGFVAYEAMYLMTVEMIQKYRNEIESDGKNEVEPKYFALLNIHGRACQIFIEILCLLKNGFADGAFARWRSLFELSIYAIFISQNSENVAMEYIRQADTDENKAMWAKTADCFRECKSNITIKKIFDNCKFSTENNELWWKQYELSSKTVHASSQGTMKRMANTGGKARVYSYDGTYKELESFIPVGASDWGLHVPAEHAVITFYQISVAFFSLSCANAEYMLMIKVLGNWVDIVRKHLYETVATCFPGVEEAAEIYKKYLQELEK